jgi:hypothetical protein
MVDYTLWDVVTVWPFEKFSEADTIKSFPVLWIARAGKILLFVGASTIVADIFGVERLNALGENLRRISALSHATEYLRPVWNWLSSQFNSAEREKAAARHRNSVLSWFVPWDNPLSFVSNLVAGYLGLLIWKHLPIETFWLKCIIFFYLAALGALVGHLITAVAAFLVMTVVIQFMLLFVLPIATILANPHFETINRSSAFIFLVFGTLPDLLTS